MAGDYGIEINTVGGKYVIRSDSGNVTQGTADETLFAVPTVTDGTNTAGGAASGSSEGCLLWARPQANTTALVIANTLSGNNYVSPTFKNAGKYLVQKKSNTAGLTNVNGTNYGIQVKNNNGTICFDSRKVAAGIEIKTIIPKGAKPGGVAPSYAQYGTNAAQNLLYTAPTTDAFNKTYVLASGGYFSGSTVEIGGFYFNHSTRQILHHSHITINYFSIGAIPLANFGEIVIGELIS